MAEAIKEAQRCLHCKVPQCKKGCPISNDIPDWIHELKKGNLGNAISIIRAKSNLPAGKLPSSMRCRMPRRWLKALHSMSMPSD